MALIQCKECKSQVSNTAKSCLSCGAAVPKPSNKKALFITGLIVFLVYSLSSSYQSAGEKATKLTTPVVATPTLDCVKNEADILAKASGMYAYYPAGALNLLIPCFKETSNPKYQAEITKAEELVKVNEANFKKQAAAVAKQAEIDKKAAAKLKKSQGVAIGMSMEDVIASSWGKPQSINTTTTATTERQQWVYGNRSYLYFQDGKLTSIQN